MKQHSASSPLRAARNLASLAILIVVSSTATAFTFGVDNLEQELQSKYKDKVVMLRNFYCGDKLRFDAQSNLLSGGSAGPWTVCRDIQIKDVKVKDGRVTLTGQRIYLSYDSKQKRFRDALEVPRRKKHEHKGDKVSIEMELQPNQDESTIQDAVSKLFYSSEEEFSGTMPRFWGSCLAPPLSQEAKPKIGPAQASSGSSTQKDHGNSPEQSSQPAANNATLHVGNGVTAPQPIFQPDPDYSDAARKAGFQGTIVMNVIIGPDGRVHNPALTRCAGLGLDEKAIEKILSWTFKPATKDGRPVAVEVSVEVSFKLQ